MKDVYVVNDLKKVIIDVGGFDLDIKSVEGEEVIVEFPNHLKDKINTTNENGILKIVSKGLNATVSFFGLIKNNFDEGEITVNIPNKYLEEFELNALAGDIDVEDIKANSFRLIAKAGDVDVTGIEADIIDLRIGAGDVDLINSVAKSINVKNTAGDMDLVNVTCEKVDLKMMAGDLDVRNSSIGDAYLEFKAGDVDFENCVIESCSGKMTAGDIEFIECEVDRDNVSLKAFAGDIRFR